MKLEDFRTEVAMLTRQELSNLSDVSISTIKRAEEGHSIGKLTRAKLLSGLGKRVARTVTKDEIDEFK